MAQREADRGPRTEPSDALDAIEMPSKDVSSREEKLKTPSTSAQGLDLPDLADISFGPLTTSIKVGYLAYQAVSASHSPETQDAGSTQEQSDSETWYDSVAETAQVAWNWLSGQSGVGTASEQELRIANDARETANRVLGDEAEELSEKIKTLLDKQEKWNESEEFCTHELQVEYEEVLEKIKEQVASVLEMMKESDLSKELMKDYEKVLGIGLQTFANLEDEHQKMQKASEERIAVLAKASPEAAALLREKEEKHQEFIGIQGEKTEILKEEFQRILSDDTLSLKEKLHLLQGCVDEVCEIHKANVEEHEHIIEQAEEILESAHITDEQRDKVREEWAEAHGEVERAFEQFERTYVSYQRVQGDLLVGIARENGIDLKGNDVRLFEAGSRWEHAVHYRWTVGLTDGFTYALFHDETEELFASQKRQIRNAFGPDEDSSSIYASNASSFTEGETEDESKESKVLEMSPIAEKVVLSLDKLGKREKLDSELRDRGVSRQSGEPSQAERLQAKVAKDLVDSLV